MQVCSQWLLQYLLKLNAGASTGLEEQTKQSRKVEQRQKDVRRQMKGHSGRMARWQKRDAELEENTPTHKYVTKPLSGYGRLHSLIAAAGEM